MQINGCILQDCGYVPPCAVPVEKISLQKHEFYQAPAMVIAKMLLVPRQKRVGT